MTVPSGETDDRTSLSVVPRTFEARAFAMKMCGVHSDERIISRPTIGCLRFGDSSRNAKRGST